MTWEGVGRHLNGYLDSSVLQEGNTPLHSFVAAEMLPAAAQLLAGGVNINSVNVWHETPLHIAAKKDLEDMTALLLAYGADDQIRVSNRTHEMLIRIAIPVVCSCVCWALQNAEGRRAADLRPIMQHTR
jgi:ankyrin repeat protein